MAENKYWFCWFHFEWSPARNEVGRTEGRRSTEVPSCVYWNEVEIEQGKTSWLNLWIWFLDLKSCNKIWQKVGDATYRPSGFDFCTSNHVTKFDKKWGILHSNFQSCHVCSAMQALDTYIHSINRPKLIGGRSKHWQKQTKKPFLGIVRIKNAQRWKKIGQKSVRNVKKL